MGGYAKLFSDIVDSSIWDEDAETRIVWVTMLALADQTGFVRGSVGWLAGKARVSNETCSKAIHKFESPDPHSRNPENDGRRIEAFERGWLLLNYVEHRDRLSNDKESAQARERMRRFREKQRNVTVGYACNVTERNPRNTEDVYASDPEGWSPEGGVIPAIGDVGQIALLFHSAFSKPPPSIPSPLVMANVKELLRIGRQMDQLRNLATWCESTKNERKPKSPQTATDPEKYEQWITMMREEFAARPKRKGPNI